MTLLASIPFLLAATFTRPLERVTTMDPAFSQAVYESRAIQLVYETVLTVDYDARPYRLAPGACDLPLISADGLTYAFHLRSTDLTAADMVRSLERLRDPALVSPNGWMLKSVATITTANPRTVVIQLKSRCHFFPWLMAMSPASILKPDGTGTGPYALTSWRKNHEMVFTLRDKFRGTPQFENGFDTIRFLVIDDASTRWLMFLKGEVDFLAEVSRDNWDAIIQSDGTLCEALTAQGIRLYSSPTMETMYMGINMKDPILGPNKKLRQALNAAFNFPEWQRFYSSRIIASTGPVPPGVDGYLATPFPYAFDLAKARQLIAEAGYPNGIDPTTGRRLVLNLAIGRASQDTREAGELIASFYDKIGVKLELSFYTWNAFLKAVDEGRVQMYNMGWVGDYPDAENFLQLFYSKNISPGPNHSNYINPAYDKEYDAAMAAETAAERNAHWARCQEIIREDCPWVFTHVNLANSLARKRIGNYKPSAFSYGHERYLKVIGDDK